MSVRLLIDAAHKEQVRMAVIDGNRLDEYDQVITDKAPIKGNIYLGKITRVEASLQAAFVDYGSNRHGFLSFAEIHPDYYKIPIADKEALLAEEEMAIDDYEDDEEFDTDGEENDSRRANNDDDQRARRKHYSQMRNRYKIQEVIKKGQIVLVQAVKEERGLKGAALTTYISIAGRYCVLMPNTTRGGGVSRKIQNVKDRRRLRDIVANLDVPKGMGVILRTAGAERSESDIQRDFDYVSNLWDEIRELILAAHAPALINQESNLVKRAIRDYYRSDIDEIIVEGEEAYEQAYSTLKALIPSHIKKIRLYENPDKIPSFTYYGVEKQIVDMTNNQVQLKGGGFIVINQTEALVAIDINSGRATRERHIEETAFKTNAEAAEEVARQIRLRDLAGLIVVDFIDMLDKSNIRKIENRLRDCLKRDRARIQVGYISGFGLLEMSRQRLRQSMVESMGTRCLHCHGTGITISLETVCMNLIREVQNVAGYYGAGEIKIQTGTELTAYLLSNYRDKISQLAIDFDLDFIFDSLPEGKSEKFIVIHALDDGKSPRSDDNHKHHQHAEDVKSDKRNSRHNRHRRDDDDGYDADETTESRSDSRRESRNDSRYDSKDRNNRNRHNQNREQNREQNRDNYRPKRQDDDFAEGDEMLDNSGDSGEYRQDSSRDNRYDNRRNKPHRSNQNRPQRTDDDYAPFNDDNQENQHETRNASRETRGDLNRETRGDLNRDNRRNKPPRNRDNRPQISDDDYDAPISNDDFMEPAIKSSHAKPAKISQHRPKTREFAEPADAPKSKSVLNNEFSVDDIDIIAAPNGKAPKPAKPDAITQDEKPAPKKRGRKPKSALQNTEITANNSPTNSSAISNEFASEDDIPVPQTRKKLKINWQ